MTPDTFRTWVLVGFSAIYIALCFIGYHLGRIATALEGSHR